MKYSFLFFSSLMTFAFCACTTSPNNAASAPEPSDANKPPLCGAYNIQIPGQLSDEMRADVRKCAEMFFESLIADKPELKSTCTSTKIDKCETQVVAGTNYRLTITFRFKNHTPIVVKGVVWKKLDQTFVISAKEIMK